MKAFVNNQKNNIEYSIFGNGKKALAIIPGLSIKPLNLKSSVFETFFKDFLDDFTIYIFNRKNNPKENYSIEDYGNDVVLILKELNINSFYLFGVSFGGMSALSIAINYPKIVEKLHIGATFARNNEISNQTFNTWLALAKENKIEELNLNMLKKVYTPSFYEKYKNVLIMGGADVSEENIRDFIIYTKAMLNFNVYNELTKIICPTYVIGSKGDNVLSDVGSYEISQKINASLFIYDETYGHAVYDEAKDYHQKVLMFLKL